MDPLDVLPTVEDVFSGIHSKVAVKPVNRRNRAVDKNGEIRPQVMEQAVDSLGLAEHISRDLDWPFYCLFDAIRQCGFRGRMLFLLSECTLADHQINRNIGIFKWRACRILIKSDVA